jgi:MinD-like ATPase involved in chromosome partitioning or flagellar assembly
MPSIISVHSFRGGTGKSNVTANLASTVARSGKRVGIVDTDIQSPGIHILFGLNEDDIGSCLNDFLWGRAQIEDTAHDVSAAALGTASSDSSGKVFLIPSSIKTGEIARVLREGYDVSKLNDGFQDILERLTLDYLFIDTHPGLNEETLLSIAISDALAIILRPDQQDYQGTSVTVEVARKLKVPRLYLIVNKVPALFDQEQVKAGVEQAYSAEVIGVLQHSDEIMALGSTGLFTLEFPEHPITAVVQRMAQTLMAQ